MRLQPDVVVQNFRITLLVEHLFSLLQCVIHTAIAQVNQTQVMGIYIVRNAAVYIEARRTAGIPMERMENNNNNNRAKNTRRKIATVHKKRESFKPHEVATPSSFGRRRRGIRQRHWNPPLQFLIRPQTLRHVAVRRTRTRPLCVSDFNTNKRPELIYRPAVSHPLQHTHAYTRSFGGLS